MQRLLTVAAIGTATPALAAGDAFFSLANTNFIVLIAFLIFVGILVYFKVPGMLMGMLDKRADQIRKDLDEAKSLREEAQTVLASFERKQAEVADQAERIVAAAKEEAKLAAEQAKADLEKSIERRLAAAEDQIASAEASALRAVRDRAIAVATAAAGEVIAKEMSASQSDKLIDDAIKTVGGKLH